MSRRLPSSTLFPYTTLFRSILISFVCVIAIIRVLVVRVVAILVLILRLVLILTLVLDRKSTRLNSSHSQISYAVFCLKKKTKQLRDKGAAAAKTAMHQVQLA